MKRFPSIIAHRGPYSEDPLTIHEVKSASPFVKNHLIAKDLEAL